MKKSLIFIIGIWFCLSQNLIAQYKLPFPSGASYKCSQSNNATTTHNGIEKYAFDFSMAIASKVVAMRSGRVTHVVENFSDYNCSNSNCVNNVNRIVIEHTDGTRALYLHLTKNGSDVEVGDLVQQGQLIGKSGSTGHSTAPHLHVMLMNPTGCNNPWYCQSIPLKFDDVSTNGSVPISGTFYTSQNADSRILSTPILTQPLNQATLSSTPIAISWNMVANADNYRLQISTSSVWDRTNGFTNPNIYNSALGNTGSFQWTNPQAGTYYWTVRAGNTAGGGSSEFAQVRSFTYAPPLCNAPIGISSSNITSNSAKINWSLNSTNTNSITLEWSPNGSVWNTTTLPSNFSYKDLSDLLPSKTYYYRLRRNCTNGGSSGYSNIYYFTTATAVSSCVAPTSMSVTNVTGSGAQVNWTLNTTNTSNIILEYSQNQSTWVSVVLNADYFYYPITGLSANTTYYYRLKRICTSGGSSAYSAINSFKTASTASIVSGGIYRLTRKGTINKVLDASGCGGWAGTNVQLWDDLNNDCQKWVFQLQTDGYYEIKRKGTTNMNLDAANCGVVGRGANVQLYDDLSNDCQRWALELQSDGFYEIKRKNSTLNLDAQGCGALAGTNVQVWDDNNEPCQRWQLTYIGSSLSNQFVPTNNLAAQSGNANGMNMSHNSNLVGLERTDDVLFNVNSDISQTANTFERIRVSPNPSRGILTFDIKKEGMKSLDIRFFNAIGQEIKHVKSQNTEGVYQSEIDVSGFANGTYYVHIFSNNDLLKNEKIVIQK